MPFSQISEILPITGHLPRKPQFSGFCWVPFRSQAFQRPRIAPEQIGSLHLIAEGPRCAFSSDVFRTTYRFRDISIQSYRILRKIDFSGAARVDATITNLL